MHMHLFLCFDLPASTPAHSSFCLNSNYELVHVRQATGFGRLGLKRGAGLKGTLARLSVCGPGIVGLSVRGVCAFLCVCAVRA